MRNWLIRILFFGILIILWEVVARLEIWPSYIFPSFSSVLTSVWTGFADGSYIRAILISLRRLVMGYGISLLLGITLGLFVGRIPLVRKTIGSIILGLQALPSVCWLPLAE